jgi:hypothetical protein
LTALCAGLAATIAERNSPNVNLVAVSFMAASKTADWPAAATTSSDV